MTANYLRYNVCTYYVHIYVCTFAKYCKLLWIMLYFNVLIKLKNFINGNSIYAVILKHVILNCSIKFTYIILKKHRVPNRLNIQRTLFLQ